MKSIKWWLLVLSHLPQLPWMVFVMAFLYWRPASGHGINAINIISSASFFFLSVPAEKHWKHFERLRTSLKTSSSHKSKKKSFFVYNASAGLVHMLCQAGDFSSVTCSVLIFWVGGRDVSAPVTKATDPVRMTSFQVGKGGWRTQHSRWAHRFGSPGWGFLQTRSCATWAAT